MINVSITPTPREIEETIWKMKPTEQADLILAIGQRFSNQRRTTVAMLNLLSDALMKLDGDERTNALMVFKSIEVALYTEQDDEAHRTVIEALPEWIPCSERLPEEGCAVLVNAPSSKNIFCAYYERHRWYIFGAFYKEITEPITAWMPLPEPCL